MKDLQAIYQEKVPRVVHDQILFVLPRSIPTNPQIVFGFVQSELLPPFVINYFMSMQPPNARVNNATRFFRALHMIENYRQWYFDTNPVAEQQAILPPPRALPPAAIDAFHRSVQASLDNMLATGTFDPVNVDQAKDYLQQMRAIVEGSMTGLEKDAVSKVKEAYDKVVAREEARRSTETQPADDTGVVEVASSPEVEQEVEPEEDEWIKDTAESAKSPAKKSKEDKN